MQGGEHGQIFLRACTVYISYSEPDKSGSLPESSRTNPTPDNFDKSDSGQFCLSYNLMKYNQILSLIKLFYSSRVMIQCMPRKGFGEYASAVCATIYTIYLSAVCATIYTIYHQQFVLLYTLSIYRFLHTQLIQTLKPFRGTNHKFLNVLLFHLIFPQVEIINRSCRFGFGEIRLKKKYKAAMSYIKRRRKYVCFFVKPNFLQNKKETNDDDHRP